MKNITKSETFVYSVIASLWTIVFFLFKDTFWAELWILAIPVEFFSLVFLLIVFIASILFWIKNGYNYGQKGDSIIVTKTSSEFINTQLSDPRVLERKSYNLTKLKKGRSFD